MTEFRNGELVWIHGELKFAKEVCNDDVKTLQGALPTVIGDHTPNRFIMVDGTSATIECRAPYSPTLEKDFRSKLNTIEGAPEPCNIRFSRR